MLMPAPIHLHGTDMVDTDMVDTVDTVLDTVDTMVVMDTHMVDMDMVTTSARDLLMLNQKLKPKLIQKHGTVMVMDVVHTTAMVDTVFDTVGTDMVDMVVMDTHMVDTDMATTMENRK